MATPTAVECHPGLSRSLGSPESCEHHHLLLPLLCCGQFKARQRRPRNSCLSKSFCQLSGGEGFFLRANLLVALRFIRVPRGSTGHNVPRDPMNAWPRGLFVLRDALAGELAVISKGFMRIGAISLSLAPKGSLLSNTGLLKLCDL